MLLFRADLWVGFGDCDCLEHIFGWMYLFRTNLWVRVPFQNLFMGGCDCVEHINGKVCLFRTYYGSMWVNMAVQSTFMDRFSLLEYIYR